MNKMKYITVSILAAGLLLGCNFLDVDPDGQVKEDKMFEDVQGYRDAMYGLYASMVHQDLYGATLSYEFADQLGQLFYAPYERDLKVNYIQNYDYLNKTVRQYVDKIWGKLYETISYANNIIAHVEKEDPLKDPDFNRIHGEALAVRAFLHFDALRYFAPNINLNENAQAVPYATEYNLEKKKLHNLRDTYQLILNDLSKAIGLLEGEGDIRLAKDGNEYLVNRYSHANLYAAYAIKARVFHYKNDLDSAAVYANKVIESDQFSLIARGNNTTLPTIKRYPADKELIWGLFSNRLTTPIWNLFQSNGRQEPFMQVKPRRDLEALMGSPSWGTGGSPTTHDYRYDNFFAVESRNPDDPNEDDDIGLRIFTRFLDKVASVTDINNSEFEPSGICLLRLPEMYYIVAEAEYKRNKEAALTALETVRRSRGLTVVLPDARTATFEAFMSSILDERRKEMWGEGQIFLEHKRQNAPLYHANNVTYAIPPSPAIFVLPWPDNEIEFGYSPE